MSGTGKATATTIATRSFSARESLRAPSIDVVPALVLFAVFTAVGVLQGITHRLALVAGGSPLPSYVPLVWHVTGALGAFCALPFVQLAVLNAPVHRLWSARLFVAHLAGYIAFTLTHVSAMLGLRWVVSAAARLPLPAEKASSAALWEAQSDLVVYGGLAMLWTLLHVREERRRALLRAAELERERATARLQALTAQLDPHFLFNALNTVSALMYEDLARTDQLLSSLGQLLRAALEPAPVEWALRDERRHTERYIELLQARFGERVRVAWDLPERFDHVMLPRFALQSLVENAAKHNVERMTPLTIRLSAQQRGPRVELTVEDDGCGFDPCAPTPRALHGLDRLEETLRLLHGEAARLERSAAERQGARVTISVPASLDAA